MPVTVIYPDRAREYPDHTPIMQWMQDAARKGFTLEVHDDDPNTFTAVKVERSSVVDLFRVAEPVFDDLPPAA